MIPSVLDFALSAARGLLYVFPVEPAILGDDKSGKKPIGLLVPNGKDDATRDENIIRAWFTRCPDANYGINTELSDITVLDVDPKHGGNESLAQFETQLTSTFTVRAGGGGQHRYFRRAAGELIQRIGARPGIDIIGNGYVVGPGSRHFSGNRYEILQNVPYTPLPQVLIDLRKVRETIAAKDIGEIAIIEGGRNNALFRLGCALRETGAGREAIVAALLAENMRRFRPPLPDGEVHAVADSVMARVEPRRDVAADAVMVEAIDAVLAEVRPHPSILVGTHTSDPIPVRRYATSMFELDKLLGGGISTRQLAVILAPPGDGKSALAVSIAIFTQSVLPVLYASTELETDELEARIAAQLLGCAWRDIVDGKIPRERVVAALTGKHIHVIGCERLPMGEAALGTIDAEIVRVAGLYDGTPPLTIIDYLQDMARGVDEKGVRAKIGSLATICRAVSQRRDCPMLVISSVSRTYYGAKRAAELRAADDATVYLAAAKESGDVDYAAAVVLFLDVVASEPGSGFRCARIAVAKSRHGETGFVGARFVGSTGKWSAAADEVLEAAEKRERTRRLAEYDTVDMKVLAAIVQAASEGTYLHAKAWRDEVPDVSGNAVRESILRLKKTGKVLLDEMHPTLHRKQGKGWFVIPVSAPVRD